MFTFHTNLNVHIPHKSKCSHSTQTKMFTFHSNLNVHIPHKPKCLHSTQTLFFAFHANLNVCIPCKPKCLHSPQTRECVHTTHSPNFDITEAADSSDIPDIPIHLLCTSVMYVECKHPGTHACVDFKYR